MDKKIIISALCCVGIVGGLCAGSYGIYSVINRKDNVDTSALDSSDYLTNITARPNTPASADENNLPQDQPTSDESVKDELKEETIDDLARKVKSEHFILYGLKDSQDHSNKVIDESMKLNRTDLYAFNVDIKQIKLDKNALSLQEDIQEEIKIKEKDYTVGKLNNGKLVITLILKQAGNKQSQPVDIELVGFKSGDETLNKIFDDETKTGEIKEKFVLTINPKTSPNTSFISIDDLNKDSNGTSGLTTWFRSSTSGADNTNLSIDGKIKLEKIEKDSTDMKTYFYLLPTDGNKFLRIKDTKDPQKTKELLIGQIRTTNLLATDITVSPKTPDEEGTKTLISELGSIDESNDKYTKKDGEENNLYLTIPKTARDNQALSEVLLNPYSIKQDQIASNRLDLELTITFGTGKEAKVYKTTKESELLELAKAGFGFHIYFKEIAQKDTKVKPSEINHTNNKLDLYFKNDNYKTPFDKADKFGAKIDVNKGAYTVRLYQPTNGTTPLQISVVKPTDNLGKNVIAFVGYTYKEVTNAKVLITPSISLINVQKMEQK